MHNFEMPTQKKYMFWSLLVYSAHTQNENLPQLSVTMNRVWYFILRVHTGTSVSCSQKEKSGEVLGTKKKKKKCR